MPPPADKNQHSQLLGTIPRTFRLPEDAICGRSHLRRIGTWNRGVARQIGAKLKQSGSMSLKYKTVGIST